MAYLNLYIHSELWIKKQTHYYFLKLQVVFVDLALKRYLFLLWTKIYIKDYKK